MYIVAARTEGKLVIRIPLSAHTVYTPRVAAFYSLCALPLQYTVPLVRYTYCLCARASDCAHERATSYLVCARRVYALNNALNYTITHPL